MIMTKQTTIKSARVSSKKKKSANTKKYIRLKKANIDLAFNTIIQRDGKVLIEYENGYENETFRDFNDYLNSLSHYYRNCIDAAETDDEKIAACNKVIDILQGYKIDLRELIKDKDLFFSEINLYNDLFIHHKQGFIEHKNLPTVKQYEYGYKEQILIMEYLGMLNNLTTTELLKHRAKIISAIIGKDADNAEKALRNIDGKPKETGKDVVKTRKNLESVKALFIDVGLDNVANEIQKDIERIDTQKKG